MDPHGGDGWKIMRGLIEELRLSRGADVGRVGGADQERMRRASKSVRRIDEYEIDRESAPIHLAQIGDGRRDVAAKHVDGDRIADLQAKSSSDLLIERDERRAGIIARPPLALGD